MSTANSNEAQIVDENNLVLLNAGAALFVAGRVRSMSAGWELAAETIDGGQAQAKLRELAGR